ncbi:MAG: lysophospholipase [Rhodobacteraceae bacterium]|nr:MAG: lysophospholipase [Paracoccaceae bacterium]
MSAKIHIIKLAVGPETVADLYDWQTMRREQLGRDHALHITRMWPKREPELLQGGSIYWVIKGFVQARQEFIGFEEIIGEDGIRRCGFMLSPDLIETIPTPRRPFQGWRYLTSENAPVDVPKSRTNDDILPDDMQTELSHLGLI